MPSNGGRRWGFKFSQHTTRSDSEAKSKTVNFPNPSRSFDATSNNVRFWGYDRSIEISFLIETDRSSTALSWYGWI